MCRETWEITQRDSTLWDVRATSAVADLIYVGEIRRVRDHYHYSLINQPENPDYYEHIVGHLYKPPPGNIVLPEQIKWFGLFIASDYQRRPFAGIQLLEGSSSKTSLSADEIETILCNLPEKRAINSDPLEQASLTLKRLGR